MRLIQFSVGHGTRREDNAIVKRTPRCTFEHFVEALLKDVPERADKGSVGWICGATFDPAYRDSENFVARELLSFDYDHITPGDVDAILATYRPYAHIAYTTWSHTPEHPRLRIWLPLSRACGYDEFQAVSRRVAACFDIEKMARESHVPAQYMFRPATRPGARASFRAWRNLEAPWVDVDAVLGEYVDWTDRTHWPRRRDGDGVHSEGAAISPLEKPGIVGDFCRAFPVSAAIERFELPYKPGSSEGRWTYTGGSRPDGAIVYDGDTKLHSHHDTDPARGQSNAFDLVRLHRFGWLDSPTDAEQPITARPSYQEMVALAQQQPEVRAERAAAEGFEDLDAAAAFEWMDSDEQRPSFESDDAGRLAPPEPITRPASKCTHQENARRLERLYGEKILGIGGQFYFWSGTHWVDDETPVWRCATKLSRIVAREAERLQEKSEREMAQLAEEGRAASPEQLAVAEHLKKLHKWKEQCASKPNLDATLGLLLKLRNFPADAMNRGKHLLNCLNGTLDLRTAQMRPHDPHDYLTTCAPTRYDPCAQAPRFERFLAEIFQENEAVIAFAKRWFGYCMTGDVREHKLVLHVGKGRNGKGTLVEAITSAVGPRYAATAAPRLLLTDSEQNSTGLADLFGARMVTISETNDAAELNEGLVKQLTGGDRIKARRLYKDYIEFAPTHKLQVFTNHKPRVRDQGFAMWERILILNYPVQFGTPEAVASGEATALRDNQLFEALATEREGILRWLVEGAREWYAEGLSPPEPVLRETREYQNQQDFIAQFLRERTARDDESRIALAGADSLFQSYKGWCTEMNYRPFGRNRFIEEVLRAAPYASRCEWRTAHGPQRGFQGLRLLEEPL